MMGKETYLLELDPLPPLPDSEAGLWLNSESNRLIPALPTQEPNALVYILLHTLSLRKPVRVSVHRQPAPLLRPRLVRQKETR